MLQAKPNHADEFFDFLDLLIMNGIEVAKTAIENEMELLLVSTFMTRYVIQTVEINIATLMKRPRKWRLLDEGRLTSTGISLAVKCTFRQPKAR